MEEELLECDVCGTEFIEEELAAKKKRKGHEYKFCGDDCKEEFEKNPEKYSKDWTKKRQTLKNVSDIFFFFFTFFFPSPSSNFWKY